MFVSVFSYIYEMPIYMQLGKWPKPMQCIQHHVREGFNGHLQMQIIGVEHYI
jgi:hypothetical protein